MAISLPAACHTAITNAVSALTQVVEATAIGAEVAGLLAVVLVEDEAGALTLEVPTLILIGGLIESAYKNIKGFSVSGAAALNNAVSCIKSLLQSIVGGGTVNMACQTTHTSSTRSNGPGACCAAFAASGLTPAVGARVAATDKNGKCIVCQVTASTSKKHPGQLVFKKGKNFVAGSQVTCGGSSGCCSLLGQ